MPDPLDAERTVLENWKRERDELDAAISVLERKISARGIGVSPITTTGKITSDEFFRMSTPDAIKKFLKIVGRPARATTDIIDGLKSGGMSTNYTNVYTALGRLLKKGEVVKVGEDWGLSEWYPPATARESKSANGKEESEELDELKEVPAETIETPEEQKEIESETVAPGPSRKQMVADFLNKNGPSTRSEILEGTDVPDGTIAYCLRDATRFVRGEGGKWRNIE